MPIIRTPHRIEEEMTDAQLRAEYELCVKNKTGFRYSRHVRAREGWVACPLTGEYFPKDLGASIYYDGAPRLVSPLTAPADSLFTDWKGRVFSSSYCSEISVLCLDGSTKVSSDYFVAREFFSTKVARYVNAYTDFNTGFRDHTRGDQKAFQRPQGEALGIEIECAFKTCHGKLLFSHWITQNYPAWICERDGSLEGPNHDIDTGLEIVSPPLTFAKLKKDLKQILEKCRELGGVGFDALTDKISYGIHVTQNLYGQNQLRDGNRYIYLINSKQLRKFWREASLRAGHPLFNDYCPFRDTYNEENGMNRPGNHYQAVYPRGESAVETRIFRSNLNYEAVCSIVELNIITMNYCKNENNPLDNAEHYATFLRANASKGLIQYINSWDGFRHLKAVKMSKKYTA